MSVVSVQDVYSYIKLGFKNLNIMATYKLKISSGNITKQERRKAAEAIKYMKQVATQPRRYFSRMSTQKSWKQRAAVWAKENPKYEAFAFSSVKSPKDIVYDKINLSVFGDITLGYKELCDAIQIWEYSRTEKNNNRTCMLEAEYSAQEIADLACKFQRQVNEMRINNKSR